MYSSQLLSERVSSILPDLHPRFTVVPRFSRPYALFYGRYSTPEIGSSESRDRQYPSEYLLVKCIPSAPLKLRKEPRMSLCELTQNERYRLMSVAGDASIFPGAGSDWAEASRRVTSRFRRMSYACSSLRSPTEGADTARILKHLSTRGRR